MSNTVSFFVRPAGRSPIAALKDLLVSNGIVKKYFGIEGTIVGKRPINNTTFLFQLSHTGLSELQENQGIPFRGFRGEQASPLQPTSVLIISKGTQEDAHLAALATVQNTCRQLGLDFTVVDSYDLHPEHFINRDLAIPIGGDGTMLAAARRTQANIPFLGVVSDPQSAKNNPLGSWGNYLLLRADEVELAFNLMARGEFEMATLPRIRTNLTTIDGKKHPLPQNINEIAVGERDFRETSRYVLRVEGQEEFISGGGLLVSCWPGATANGWINNALGFPFGPSNLLHFMSMISTRYHKDSSERALLAGFAEEVKVNSKMHGEPVIGIDGKGEQHSFPMDARLTIKADGSPLSMPIFPSIRRKTMTPPQQPVAEIGEKTNGLELSPRLITEIDDLSVNTSVPDGSVRPILFLQVSEDMKQLHLATLLKRGGTPLGQDSFDHELTVHNPTLLYPSAEIGSAPADQRDVLLNLYGYGVRITEHAGVLVDWDSSVDRGVWTSSIDTIAVVNTMLKHELLGPHINSAAEVATGGGMIAKAIAMFCPNLKNLVITDIIREAIECSGRNLSPVLQGRNVKLKRIVGPGIIKIPRVDLMAINPPYLPEKKVSGEVDQYRGLDLLLEILRDGRDHLTEKGSILVDFSSCSDPETSEWIEKYGWKRETLLQARVPLKITRLSKDHVWRDWLLERGGIYIRDERKTGYRYWHTLNLVHLKP